MYRAPLIQSNHRAKNETNFRSICKVVAKNTKEEGNERFSDQSRFILTLAPHQAGLNLSPPRESVSLHISSVEYIYRAPLTRGFHRVKDAIKMG